MSLFKHYAPKNLDEIKWQPLVTNSLKQVIANNLHSKKNSIDANLSFGSMLFSGPPSVGKSITTLIYARSTLCKNRPEGSYLGCGHCDVCIGKDTSNILYYTISDLTEAKNVLDKFIEESKTLPIAKDVRPDQYRKFIIIDEAELMSHQLISKLLEPLEHSIDTTTWILISMDLEKLYRLNAAVAEAIVSRCVHYKMEPYTYNQIAETISEQREIEYDAAYLIAKNKKNFRESWNTVSQLESIGSITTELVTDYLYKGIDKSVAKSIINNLESGLSLEIDDLDYSILTSVLIDFLTEGVSYLTEDGISLLSDLLRYKTLVNSYPIKSLLSIYLNKKLTKIKKIKPKSEVTIKQMDDFLEKKNVLQAQTFDELLSLL